MCDEAQHNGFLGIGWDSCEKEILNFNGKYPGRRRVKNEAILKQNVLFLFHSPPYPNILFTHSFSIFSLHVLVYIPPSLLLNPPYMFPFSIAFSLTIPALSLPLCVLMSVSQLLCRKATRCVISGQIKQIPGAAPDANFGPSACQSCIRRRVKDKHMHTHTRKQK